MCVRLKSAKSRLKKLFIGRGSHTLFVHENRNQAQRVAGEPSRLSARAQAADIKNKCVHMRREEFGAQRGCQAQDLTLLASRRAAGVNVGRVVEAQFWKLSGAKFSLGMPHATGNYATTDCPDSRLPVNKH